MPCSYHLLFLCNTKEEYERFRCPVDATTSILKPSSVGVSRFNTEGFKFIADHPFVFVHCQIRICNARDSKSRCTLGCVNKPRKRREVTSHDKLYALAQGPFTISNDPAQIESTRKSVAKGTSKVFFICTFFLWRTLLKPVAGFTLLCWVLKKP